MLKKLFAFYFCLTIFLFSVLSIHAQTKIKPIETEISNGLISARIYLPDKEAGYNRGSRFDWAGVSGDLKYKNHTYFGQWIDTYTPTSHDAVMGPVEAFDPVGFDEAKLGGAFIKIGVGALIKPDDSAYNFMKSYAISDHGKWKVKSKPNQVSFFQVLNEKEYAYEYKKTLQLKKHRPIMVLTHTLKNTGKKTIETSVYDHNFFVIDQQATGPGFVVTFPNDLNEKLDRMEDYVTIKDNQLIFLKELKNKYISFNDLTNGKGAPYNIKIENQKTGAGVRITGNHEISKLAFWSSLKTICPEPYIKIKAKPGEEISWKITYEYYTVSK